MSKKAAISLRNHVCDRLKERFGLTIDYDGYNELNIIAKNSHTLYDSEIENCDFREVLFKDKKMVCIFDIKLNKVKTVLIPFSINSEEVLIDSLNVSQPKTLKVGQKVDGNLLFVKPNYGAFILLNDQSKYYIGVLHETEMKSNVDLSKILKYMVISNFVEKKGKMAGKRRIFLKLIYDKTIL